MEDIILENHLYGNFNLIFDDFSSSVKLNLERDELKKLRDKINNILEETR